MRMPYGFGAVLILVVLGPNAVLAQFQLSPDLESRYMGACLKDDTERYCHCELEALKPRVKNMTDWEFLIQLEEETIGKSEDATNEIFNKLPPERQRFIVNLLQELDPILDKCPDRKQQ